MKRRRELELKKFKLKKRKGKNGDEEVIEESGNG